MGAKKQWTGQEKLSIVLQGLKGTCSVKCTPKVGRNLWGVFYGEKPQKKSATVHVPFSNNIYCFI